MLWIVTAASVGLAGGMAFVAWRAGREERRGARVVALAAEVRCGTITDLPLHDVVSGPSTAASGASNGEAAATPRPSRTAAAIALAVLVVGSGAALAVVLSGSSAVSRANAIAAARADAPLELVALGHERDGDALAIHGTVRNPAAGETVDDLSAVVFLFDRGGRVVTSARAAIEDDDLAPGADSRFTVVVPSAQDVARYRVSFRTDRGIVAHVDRRAAPGSTR